MFPKCPVCEKSEALRPSWHKGAHDCRYCGRRFLRGEKTYVEVSRPRSELGSYVTRELRNARPGHAVSQQQEGEE